MGKFVVSLMVSKNGLFTLMLNSLKKCSDGHIFHAVLRVSTTSLQADYKSELINCRHRNRT